MLSSDKNVETIAQLAEVVKHWLGLQGEYLKLDIVDKTVRLLTATALALLFLLIFMAVVLYFSIAVACWLAAYVGYTAAFFMVGFFHLLVFLLIVAKRKSWIERPLVHFFVNLIMS